MTREQLNRAMEWLIPEEESSKNLHNESGEHLVVVNLTHRGCGNGFYIPGEEASTHDTLKGAAQQVIDLMDENYHTIETARIFKLVPVPLNQVAVAIRELIPAQDWDDYEELLEEE